MIVRRNSATAAREGELIWSQICDCSMQRVKQILIGSLCCICLLSWVVKVLVMSVSPILKKGDDLELVQAAQLYTGHLLFPSSALFF